MKRVIPAWVTHPCFDIILLIFFEDILLNGGSQRYYISIFRGLGAFSNVQHKRQ